MLQSGFNSSKSLLLPVDEIWTIFPQSKKPPDNSQFIDSFSQPYRQTLSFQYLQQGHADRDSVRFPCCAGINRSYSVNDRGVITTAKSIADFRVTVRSQVRGIATSPPGAAGDGRVRFLEKVGNLDLVVIGDSLLDVVDAVHCDSPSQSCP
jgi:hypothetical protein